MREIKFRAWHKDSKEMLHAGVADIFIWQHEKQPIEIMQYTGLLDKQGKEIYEGDVLKNGAIGGNNPERIKVAWNDQEGGFCGVVGITALPLSCAWFHYGNCEVIGNIYENPELLK